MKITRLLADSCPHGEDCDRIHDTDGDDVIVQGRTLTDQATIDRLHLPAEEGAVAVRRDLVRPSAMNLAEMSAFIAEHHTSHLLRIENRRAYQSVSDGGDFARYLQGEPEPREGGQWHEKLRRDAESGKRRAKVHIVTGDGLTDYEKYECEWGFIGTVAAGEDVRIATAGQSWPTLLDIPDFTVIDYAHVVRMIYGDDNRFRYAEVVTDTADAAAYRALADAIWTRGLPFTAWWANHPEEHRKAHAA